MFLKRAFPLCSLTVLSVERGRFILCPFLIFGSIWRVISVYARNHINERLHFFGELMHTVIVIRELFFWETIVASVILLTG